MAKRSKTHDIILRVRFNKPVGRMAAVRAAKSNLHGEVFYAMFGEEYADGWSTFSAIVRSKKPEPKP